MVKCLDGPVGGPPLFLGAGHTAFEREVRTLEVATLRCAWHEWDGEVAR